MAIKLGIEIIKFLNAARNLVKNKAMSKEGILRFAKQEFGEVSDFLRLQIDRLFKTTKGTPSKSKGEVIDVSFKPGKDKKGRVVEESPSQKQGGIETIKTRKEYKKELDEALGPADDVFGSPIKDQKMKDFDKVKAKDVTPKGEVNPITDQMSNQKREFLGFPNRAVEAIVRTAARDVLEKAGLGPRIKGQDPIDMARQIYGDEILDALDNIAGELQEASSYPEIARILSEKKIYDFKPRKGLDITKKGEIEDITAFDPTDRTKNADGGLIDILKL